MIIQFTANKLYAGCWLLCLRLRNHYIGVSLVSFVATAAFLLQLFHIFKKAPLILSYEAKDIR